MLTITSMSYRSILRDITFSIEKGEFVALIGPNGAGKSTLLQVAAGFLAPTSGIVQLADRPIRSYRAKQRAARLSYMPQTTVLDVPYTVSDIIQMGAYAHDRPDHDIIEKSIARCHVEHLLHRDLRSLSGGERQRALLAKALVQKADYLLLDEPVSALDIQHQLEILTVLKSLAQEGQGVFVSIHHLEHVVTFADRVILLCDGKITADHAVRDVMSSHALCDAFAVDVALFDDPFTGEPRLSFARKSEGERVHRNRVAVEGGISLD
ncbi:hypothetical protein AYW79_02385 [Ferroacidibacillus organovorans]|uniref:ABC transporter domain-containing protein n=2 Tax=Ferroacidibacillus organovorans TaxID=1765683 RepID=A0A853KI75_9BACL|nr:ABC transporter ATP-binding protein [Ferroacidibacillus organovorans]OAG95080.1 hypothetical protein AYW79_02385 [Ferroacidibacillus organovorans]